MALADAIRNATRKPGGKCTIATLYEQLDSMDAEALTSALADPRIPASAILRALTAEGHEVTRAPVERHRRGECACGPR